MLTQRGAEGRDNLASLDPVATGPKKGGTETARKSKYANDIAIMQT